MCTSRQPKVDELGMFFLASLITAVKSVEKTPFDIAAESKQPGAYWSPTAVA
jgi:hypothetical protein